MDVPRQLAMIPFRDSVLFPGAEKPMYVGREATMRAIIYAQEKADGIIGVFTQVAAENPGPLSSDDVYEVGTCCRIVACVKLKDDSMKVQLEGLDRIRMTGFRMDDKIPIVTIEPWPEVIPTGHRMPETDRQDLLKLLASWRPDYGPESELIELRTFRESNDSALVVQALRALLATPSIASEGMERAWWDLDKTPAAYIKLLNEAVAKRQQVLEESDYHQQVVLLRQLIEFDITCRNQSFD